MTKYNTKFIFDDDDENKAKRKLLPSMLEHYKIIGEYISDDTSKSTDIFKTINGRLEKIDTLLSNMSSSFGVRGNFSVFIERSQGLLYLQNSIVILKELNLLEPELIKGIQQLEYVSMEDFNKFQLLVKSIEKLIIDIISKAITNFNRNNMTILDFDTITDNTEKIQTIFINLKKYIDEILSNYNQLVNRKKLLIKKGGCVCDVNDMVYNAREWREPNPYI